MTSSRHRRPSERRTAPPSAPSSSPSFRSAIVSLRRFHLHVPLVAALLYGGLWLLMNVAFIGHSFPMPFLTGMAFYRRYSNIAGGPVQYLANLFSQAYSRHWAGVLAFTLLALAAWAIARGILRRFSSGSCNWPCGGLSPHPADSRQP